MLKNKSASANSASKKKRANPKTQTPVNIRSKETRVTKPRARVPSPADKPAKSKCDQVLQMLRRNKGASLAELQEATGWQAHSIRGFLSGTVKKRMGLSLSSVKSEQGERRYMIAEA